MAYRTLRGHGWEYDDLNGCTVCAVARASCTVDGDPVCEGCARHAAAQERTEAS